ncbi:MAG: hypothetical protein H0X30_20310 [Anaerolineae bacterium]|nr:hypothetical protein [Anaerolineae bacterium]
MPISSSQQLIQSVIDEFQQHPEKLGSAPTPLDPEVLANLTFPDGKALPPSLKQWLAFDAASLGLFSDLANLVITPTSLSDWGNHLLFDTMQRLLLPENIYAFYPGWSSYEMWFLYAGQADDEGEYPIFVAVRDDDDFAQLFAPNFAVWLAIWHKIPDFSLYQYYVREFKSLFGHPDYRTAMREQSALNFRSNRICDIYGEAIAINGTLTRWCSKDEVIADLRKQGFDDERIKPILEIHFSGL